MCVYVCDVRPLTYADLSVRREHVARVAHTLETAVHVEAPTVRAHTRRAALIVICRRNASSEVHFGSQQDYLSSLLMG